MAVAEVDIINAALTRASARVISSISDSTPGGLIAGDVYTFERDEELRAHVWNFAVTRVRLPRLTVLPKFEFAYAYKLPSDWLRTVSVHDNEAGAGQVRYKQEGILTSELLTNGDFDEDASWTKGTGWAISGGQATKTAGSGSDLSQSITTVASAVYRISYLVSGMSAGTLTPKFTGGTTVTGTAISEDGYYAEEFTAISGNNAFVLTASSTFDGSVDDVSVVRMDGAAGAAHCITSGAEAIWMRYVRKGTDPDFWVPSFRQVLILRMAKVFAVSLANSGTLMEGIHRDLKDVIARARSIDGIEDFPEDIPEGKWARDRFSNRDDRFSTWTRR